jgi:hypothetical protein
MVMGGNEKTFGRIATMKTRIPFVIGSVLAVIPGLAMANQVQLGFLPPSQTAAVGSFVQVALGISLLNIGEPPSLGAYDVTVSFNPGLLVFSQVDFGDPVLGNQLDVFRLGTIQKITPGDGTVQLFELSLDSAADLDSFQVGDFTLFTLTFAAVAPGSTALNLDINALADAVGAPLTATTESGSIITRSVPNDDVPEPTTAALLGLSLVVLAFGRIAGFHR